jgi:hypothetical protein
MQIPLAKTRHGTVKIYSVYIGGPTMLPALAHFRFSGNDSCLVPLKSCLIRRRTEESQRKKTLPTQMVENSCCRAHDPPVFYIFSFLQSQRFFHFFVSRLFLGI